MLVIDSSLSMKGEPIEKAMAAARAFVDNRASQEQLGVIFFNGTTKVALEPTTNDGEIPPAIGGPPTLAFGTHINDAVQAAVNLLDEKNVDIGSIVLLSDGADVGSKTTEAAGGRGREARASACSRSVSSPARSRASRSGEWPPRPEARSRSPRARPA